MPSRIASCGSRRLEGARFDEWSSQFLRRDRAPGAGVRDLPGRPRRPANRPEPRRFPQSVDCVTATPVLITAPADRKRAASPCATERSPTICDAGQSASGCHRLEAVHQGRDSALRGVCRVRRHRLRDPAPCHPAKLPVARGGIRAHRHGAGHARAGPRAHAADDLQRGLGELDRHLQVHGGSQPGLHRDQHEPLVPELVGNRARGVSRSGRSLHLAPGLRRQDS